jgi:ferrochelatase
VAAALARLPHARPAGAAQAITAHSLPVGMAAACDYEAQLREASALVEERLGRRGGRLVFQSRSGPPSQPWLEPDILSHLQTLHDEGVQDVVAVPIGFISDHMEVVYDLDVQAAEKARELGLGFQRAATVGTAPAFVEMIRELVLERTAGAPRRALGSQGPRPDVCPDDCCLSGPRRP